MRHFSETFKIWRAGLHIGTSVLLGEPVLGLKRLLLPVSYWRTAEFSYALRQLALPRGSRLLDVGSPKDLALILARTRDFEVVATDILPQAITTGERYAVAHGRAGTGRGKVRFEQQDARALGYPSNSFAAAFSISVLEHIPDRGDTVAIRELIRVVKPGGLVVVTTPYDLNYRETFIDGSVYERMARPGERLFFERHYDAASLEERLLRVDGARVADLELWAERGPPVEHVLNRLGRARAFLSPVEALLASLVLRPVPPNAGISPLAAFFTLVKL